MNLGGIVLAGGRSSRMGRDKAGLDWHGRPLVAHVAAILQTCVAGGPVVVVGPAGMTAADGPTAGGDTTGRGGTARYGGTMTGGDTADGGTMTGGDTADGGTVGSGGTADGGGAPAWVGALPQGVELVGDDVAHPGPVAGLAAGLAALDGRARVALVAATDQPFLSPATFTPLLHAAGEHGSAAWRAGGHLQPLGAVYAVGAIPPGVRRLTELLAPATILAADAETTASLRSLDTPEAYGDGLR